jgi:hypothetical protein
MKLGGRIQLRAWFLRRGGADGDKCNTFTLSEGYRLDQNWVPKKNNVAEKIATQSTG